MPELRNPRWERFCQNYVTLGNGSEALRRSGYRARNTKVASVDSAQLLAYPSIKKRIEELRAKALLCHELDREGLARFYSSVIVTPAGHVSPDHPLAQSVEVSEKGTKVRLPDKNAAAAGLARLHGWDAAQRVEVTVDNPLTAYLRELRGKSVQVIDNQ